MASILVVDEQTFVKIGLRRERAWTARVSLVVSCRQGRSIHTCIEALMRQSFAEKCQRPSIILRVCWKCRLLDRIQDSTNKTLAHIIASSTSAAPRF